MCEVPKAMPWITELVDTYHRFRIQHFFCCTLFKFHIPHTRESFPSSRSIAGFCWRREEGGRRFAGRGWCGCGSSIHRFLHRRRWSADGSVGACSPASGSKVVVIGFFFCEDEDLPDVYPFHLAGALNSGRLRRRMEQRIVCL
jgi:hypothetical protein